MSEWGDRPQWLHKTFRLEDLCQFVEPTAYDPSKVMQLRESIRSTGYWDNHISAHPQRVRAAGPARPQRPYLVGNTS